MSMKKILEGIVTTLVATIVIVMLSGFASFITGLIFKLCWNYVAAEVFHAPTLDFWHAYVGMMLLHTLGGALSTRVKIEKE